MKYQLLSLCILLCLFSCTELMSQTKENDLTEANLKGKVKSERTIDFHAVEKNDEIVRGKISTYGNNYQVLYNIDGNRIEMTNYNSNRLNMFNPINKNDGNGNQVYQSDEILKDKHTYKYDDEGNKIEENEYNKEGNLVKRNIYKYDDDGNKIEENEYIYERLSDKHTYKYDGNGNMIEENSPNWSRAYKYDGEGNVVEQNIYNSNGSLDKKWTFKYNKEGNLVKWNQYNSNGSLDKKWTYKYNKEGNWVKTNSYNSDGSLDTKGIAKYDTNGNIVEIIGYNSDGRFAGKTYFKDIDKYGNWLKKEEHKGPHIYIRIREIEYYK